MTDTISEIITERSKYNEEDLCPNCGSTPKDHILEDYDMMWHDGNVMCKLCGTKVRNYDAG